jgi:hypothetical protein
MLLALDAAPPGQCTTLNMPQGMLAASCIKTTHMHPHPFYSSGLPQLNPLTPPQPPHLLPCCSPTSLTAPSLGVTAACACGLQMGLALCWPPQPCPSAHCTHSHWQAVQGPLGRQQAT